MLMGMCVAGLMNIYNNKDYFKKFRANGNRSVPEARLPPMMIGGVLFAIGLFVFGCKPPPPFPLLNKHTKNQFTPQLTPHPRVLRPQNQLLALHNRHLPHRRRLHRHFPILPQLPRRHLHPLQRQRRRRQHVPARHVRGRLPPLRGAHVSQHRHRLGQYDFRVRGGHFGACAGPFFEVGEEY